MTRPLSMDIRSRLVKAVSDGMTRRSAAKRFGVAASTAIKWVDQWERTGGVEPRPQGGDHRSHHIEAYAEEILGLIEARRDITLLEITEHLEREHGLKVAQSTVWRLLDRHDMTFKKKPHTPTSSSVLTSCGGAGRGSSCSRNWTRIAWCLSTRREPRPRWRGAAAAHHGASAAGRRYHTGTGRPRPSWAPCGLAA